MPRHHATDWVKTPEADSTVQRKADRAEPAGADPSASWLLRLQSSAGNAAVVDMLSRSADDAALVQRRGGRGRNRGGGGGGTPKPSTTPAPPTTATPAPPTTTPAPTTGTPTTGTPTPAPPTTATPTTGTPTTGTPTTGTPTPAPPTTATPPSATPAPTPEEVKAKAVETTIGATNMTSMTTTFGTRDAVVKYADDLGGAAKLKDLLTVRRLTPAILQQYGAPMLKSFVGCGTSAWNHLVTATYKRGVVSGGHDDDAFYDCLSDNGLEVLGSPYRRNGDTYKVTYGYYDEDGNEVSVGSKTLIEGLAGKKGTWQGYFNKAIWNAIRAGTFPTASAQFSCSADGYWYSGWYKAGSSEVDTVFPS